MAVSTINNYATYSSTRNFNITGSNQLYDMHNQIPLHEPHFCTVRSDVMEARTGENVTGHGYCMRLDNDVTDFVLIGGYYLIVLRVSGNAVARRIKVGMEQF